MALAGPTPDNPFLTLKKRLKRARFYDGRERMEYESLLAGQQNMRRKPLSAWDIAQRPAPATQAVHRPEPRSEEHTSELQSLMRISYAVFCLKKKKYNQRKINPTA